MQYRTVLGPAGRGFEKPLHKALRHAPIMRAWRQIDIDERVRDGEAIPFRCDAPVSINYPLGSADNFAVKLRILVIGNLAAAIAVAPIALWKLKEIQHNEGQTGDLREPPGDRRFAPSGIAEYGDFFHGEACPPSD